MKKILLLSIILLCFFQKHSFSQLNKIDSLLTLLKTDNLDTIKVQHLYNLSDESETVGNYEDGVIYGNKAIELADQIIKNSSKNDRIQKVAQKYKAKSYLNIGIIYKDQSDYTQALNNFLSSLKIMQDISDKKGIAYSLNNIASIYKYIGDIPTALKNYFASLKLLEELKDNRGVAASYDNIGVIYWNQSNYTEALKNHSAALKIREKIGDKKGVAASLTNIGNVYGEIGNYSTAQKNFFASLKLYEEIGDRYTSSNPYQNIGIMYGKENKFDEALKYMLISLKIREEFQDQAGISNSCNNIGFIYFKQKKFKEAEAFENRAKEVANKIGRKLYLENAYFFLTKIDSAKGDYKGAFENHKLYILYHDSLDNEETRKKTIQSQMNYEFGKKEAIANAEHKKELENQEAIAEEKSHKQKIVIVSVVIGLLFVLVFAGFVFRTLRITSKQKNIIELQKHIVEEHQKEIIDSITYAKRLQQAILPSDNEIYKYLPDSFILYKPKDIVAGDFYWMHISPNEDVVFIAAADSTGHGVPGAMVSVVCSNALNRAVNEFNLIDTGKILDKTRELVLETFAKSGEAIKDGMDISLLAINKTKNELQWSGANNSLWYIQNNELKEIKPDKQSIGQTENPEPFRTNTIEFKSGTQFYLFTDGYADQFGGSKGKKFKYKQLQEILIATSCLSLPDQKVSLLNSLNSWKGNLEQVDDITLIGIRI